MGQQEMSLLRWVLCIVVVLSAICGSIGSDISPSPEISFELPHKRSASSPANLIKTHSAYAPSPITLPKGSVSQPAIISPPKFEAVSPTIQAIIPSVPPSAPPDHASKEHKWSRMISPSIGGQAPNIPHGAAHDLSPSTSPLAQIRKGMPVAGDHGEAPDSNFLFTSPHAPASSPLRRFPLNPPNMLPSIARLAPSVTHSPHTIFDRPAMSPMLITSPIINGMPVAAPPKEISSHLSPVNHSHLKGSSEVISPAPCKVKEPSNITHAPLALPPHPSGSSPVISPVPHEVKPSNITHAPLASPSHPSGSSPEISPMPHEMKKPSNLTHAPLPSHPHPSGSSPVMSPVPHDVRKPSNITHAPLASPSHPSGSSPEMSPVPHEMTKPSNITHAPLPSHPHPLGSSPVISPVPHGVKNGVKKPSNITHAPLASYSHSSAFSPVINPVPHEVKKPSNITHAPWASHPHPPAGRTIQSPALAPTSSLPQRSSRQRVGNPASAPFAAFPPSSYHPGPVISPAPALLPAVFPNNKRRHHAPPPYIRGTNLVKNSEQHRIDIAHAPLPSHPHPLGSSPVISPVPHGVKNGVKKPSNITHGPLASYSHPSAFSPVINPVPHEVKKPSNITHAPMASHPHPPAGRTIQSPALAPTSSLLQRSSRQRVGNPASAPFAAFPPSSYHPGPVISPAPALLPAVFLNNKRRHHAPPPYIRGTNLVKNSEQHGIDIAHAPLPSHPHPLGSSPVISPVPHGVKNGVKKPSNITHAPLASYSHPSVFSPVISPVSHEVKKPSNITHAPLASHPHPPAGRTIQSPALAPTSSLPQRSSRQRVGSPASAPFASFPPSSYHPEGPVISPAPALLPAVFPNNKQRHHAPPPYIRGTNLVKNSEQHRIDIAHAPLPSHPHPLGSSPVISPVPHGVKNGVKKPSNIAHAPLASYAHPSVISPVISPVPHEVKKPSNIIHAPLASHPHPPAGRTIQSPALAPTSSLPQRSSRQGVGNPASAPFASFPPSSYHPGPVISPAPALLPAVFPNNKRRHHAPPPYIRGPSLSPSQVPSHPPEIFPNNKRRHYAPSPYIRAPSLSPIHAPISSTDREVAHAPSPSSVIPSRHNKWPIHSPILPPSGSFSRMPRAPVPQPVWALPPPPPNLDCNSLTCLDPFTYPPLGSLCVCVLPIKVGLRLSITLYTFFPLVSELAQEIASGIFMKQSQVRIMGANAASEDPEKTIVLIDLVPFGRSFDSTTPLFIYERFWHKQVLIKASYLGDYDVLYVRYPGLPPSPPEAPTNINVDGGASSNDNNGRTIRPLAVDVRKRKEKVSGRLIAIIVLSSVIALVLSVGAVWLLLLKRRHCSLLPAPTSQTLLPPFAKSSVAVTGPAVFGSRPSSSASFSSSIAAYTGSAKTFSLAEMERATDRFDDSRIIGEGGFGRVYHGTLEDGTMVAVKVLKREDQQGGREFLAEVEMLSRLHHRNLVKLIGICTEENVRCLVYELIPNGSVESHLHGMDKDSAPLDWNARMKIALGAARGLAYLHEDSNPRVIHRDFKSSNILLEHDFTPKVSDFGLARTALDEGNEHISTRVMGTFGYVAPEYAMTGHLLVKSDVYSYGVVLLELLTGRKPVDMSQPLGQENLVNWARPLLTSMDGLGTIIDPALGTNISFDSVAKVAAIASMCVQPEVSHRPFMGEVVQALKLVCNDSDEYRRSCSQDESSTKGSDIRISTRLGLEQERVLSESDIFCTSAWFARDASGSFRRCSSSGPLRTGRSAKFWQRVRGFSSGSTSENGVALKLGTGLEGGNRWP